MGLFDDIPMTPGSAERPPEGLDPATGKTRITAMPRREDVASAPPGQILVADSGGSQT